MFSLKHLLPVATLALTALAQLPASGGPYAIFAAPNNDVVKRFMNVFDADPTPGTPIIGQFISGLNPQPNELWNIQKISDDGFFGIYTFTSVMANNVSFSIGNTAGSQAFVSSTPIRLNVTRTSTPGAFTINVPGPQLFLTAQVPLTTAPGGTDPAQLWHFGKLPVCQSMSL